MNSLDASIEVSKIKQERIQEKKLKPTQGSGNLTQLRLKEKTGSFSEQWVERPISNLEYPISIS
jgi:hypothetical protein